MLQPEELQELVRQVESEFRIDVSGKATCTIRGAARLCSVDHKSISSAFQPGEQNRSKLSKFLTQHGFEAGEQNTWLLQGIPDVALGLILEYYAYVTQKNYQKKQAQAFCRVFKSIGIRTWVQKALGWNTPQEENQLPTSAIAPIEPPKTATEIVLASARQNLMFAEQLVEQERALAALRAEVKEIQPLKAEVEQIKQVQQEAIAGFAELEPPTVAVPDLTPRDNINRLVRDYCIEKAMPFNEVWNMVYREFVYRHHIDLKARSREAVPKKRPIDIADELGKMKELYAVAYTILRR